VIIYPSPESLENHPVVARDQWLIARMELLKEEKESTRLRDKINAQRRDLPWVRVEEDYLFRTPNGPKTLADLFDGRSQLFIKHFMFAPGWKAGCVGCSFVVDSIEGALVHLENHDVTCVAVSRATLAEIEAFKQRMGWRIPWVSSFGSDFNYDYHVSFAKEEIAEGKAYRNYKNARDRKRGNTRHKCVLQERGRRRFPYLFDLRPRGPRADQRIHVLGPDAQGPQRDRSLFRYA
jgi:predicted dithiol-disulfide oxidoreductase (DUF899 family)